VEDIRVNPFILGFTLYNPASTLHRKSLMLTAILCSVAVLGIAVFGFAKLGIEDAAKHN
jgi:hypothetical protein